MDMKEFNEVVRAYVHDYDELILDVRPLRARQGEAVDSYLHSRLTHVNTTGIGNTNRLVVLVCDATADLPESARALIETLAASGQWVEIRHGCPAKAFTMSG
jgi:hypothetical protein